MIKIINLQKVSFMMKIKSYISENNHYFSLINPLTPKGHSRTQNVFQASKRRGNNDLNDF